MDKKHYTVLDKYKEYFQYVKEFELGLFSLGFECGDIKIECCGTVLFWQPNRFLDSDIIHYLKNQGFKYVGFPEYKSIYYLGDYNV